MTLPKDIEPFIERERVPRAGDRRRTTVRWKAGRVIADGPYNVTLKIDMLVDHIEKYSEYHEDWLHDEWLLDTLRPAPPLPLPWYIRLKLWLQSPAEPWSQLPEARALAKE